MHYTISLTGLAIVLAAGVGLSGEPSDRLTALSKAEGLTPESLLPVHEESDAYTPCAAFGPSTPSTGSGQAGSGQGKDVYLVAWQSGRLAPGDLREGLKFNASIVGCRVDKSGKTLDAKPFPIASAASLGKLAGTVNLRQQPQAAFAPSVGSGQGGDVFLVVWQDLRNGKDWDVYAARISPEGKVLDPDGILVSGGPHNQALPRVAWDGKTFVVVWQDYRSGDHYDIYGARVGASGKVEDPQGFAISLVKDKGNRYTPAIASAGGGKSFVYWVGATQSYGELPIGAYSGGDLVVDGKASPAFFYDPRKFGEGELRQMTAPASRTTPLAMAAGNGGRAYLVTWQNWLPGYGTSASNVALFDETGSKRMKVLQVRAGEQARNCFALRGFVVPDACWDGSAFLVAWDQVLDAAKPAQGWFNAVHVVRISPEGEVVTATQLVSGTLASPAHEAAVASDGAGTTLIAYEKQPEKGDVPVKIGFRILMPK